MLETRLDRRDILRSAGGALAILAAGGRLYAAPAPTPGRLPDGDAFAPWTQWNDASLSGTTFALISAAVLAANPHDTQPWRFRVTDETVEVYADCTRNLGAMDPYLREMHLGLGCAIENMTLAGPSNGYSVRVDPVPGALTDIAERKQPLLAATLTLVRDGAGVREPLCDAIPLRHTNRNPYDRTRPPPPDWLALAGRIGESAGLRVMFFTEGAARERLEAAMTAATKSIVADAEMAADSDRWFRSSTAEIEAHRDGPNLDTAGLSFWSRLFARVLPVSAQTSHDAWISMTRDTQAGTAPCLGLIAAKDRYDRPAAIAAGRCWQRLHLSATANGLAMQPINQPIEMIDRERQLGRGREFGALMETLTGPDWQATFSFRVGYSARPGPASPRRPLADVVMQSF